MTINIESVAGGQDQFLRRKSSVMLQSKEDLPMIRKNSVLNLTQNLS